MNFAHSTQKKYVIVLPRFHVVQFQYYIVERIHNTQLPCLTLQIKHFAKADSANSHRYTCTALMVRIQLSGRYRYRKRDRFNLNREDWKKGLL